MNFACSPHREGGTMHLPSPTHPHSYRLDQFSHLQQLRRSLSRSPSKPQRFQMRTTDSPRSPLSPMGIARVFQPGSAKKQTSPPRTIPESPLAAHAAPAAKRFSLRRSAPFRQSPRTRNSKSKSPRRPLGDSTDTGNAMPFTARPTEGQENTPRRPSAESPDSMDTDIHLPVNDKPIKFAFAQSRPDLSPAPPAKSSPLKRNDASMCSTRSNGCSPVAKRRSLHGASSLGVDFESIFDQPSVLRTSLDDAPAESNDTFNAFSFNSPTSTPLRRTTSLRKSTLSQRASNTPRGKPGYDGDFALPGAAASKTRNRMSLDSSLSTSQFGSTTPVQQASFRMSTFDASRMGLPQQSRGSFGHSQQPHPLSFAHTPSSTTCSDHDEIPMAPPRSSVFGFPQAAPAAPSQHFSRSLPIGIGRPKPDSEEGSQDSFDTPFKADPQPPIAFSTGLLSKKNRNVDDPAAGAGVYIMPDTPSKRQSFPPANADRGQNLDTPLVKRKGSLFGDSAGPQHQFGTPSTPFSSNVSKFSVNNATKRPSIFGNIGGHQRRGSFISIDGDDDTTLDSQSPTANRMTDSQSSVDELPPTPTKHNNSSSRRSKESSLRRRTFRGSRPSICADTFAVPDANERPTTAGGSFGAPSPQTPNDFFAAPDASKLSISGPRRGSHPFAQSLSALPPATPTTPRDAASFFASYHGEAPIPIGLTKNDVDESLAQRFQEVKQLDGGEGEFSMVFKASRPVQSTPSHSPAGSQICVVKKSKKPYLGAGDRARKMREVDILYALKGNEHVLDIKTHWEFESHLYIQTEYCEGGNLRKFLDQTGYGGRLDDFRIWKILLELSMGLAFIHKTGYIHLDMKPANVLIDFEGGLKIADFGLASQWPAPRGIEGEGDRHYLAPEAMQGRFDKPADVFALGMMLTEIAGNCVIPENGLYWQKLRSGEFDKVLPSLTWSADSATLDRDSNGDPISGNSRQSMDGFLMSDADNFLSEISVQPACKPEEELARAPSFMIEQNDSNSMDCVVKAMLHQDPDMRPTAEQVLQCFGCRWAESRRRAGATVYEGNFGPSEEVLATYTSEAYHDIDADMMDMS